MFKRLRQRWKSCDYSFIDHAIEQQVELNKFAECVRNAEQNELSIESTNRWHNLCEELALNGTTWAHFTIFDEAKEPKKPDRQRCQYCGCLVSSFDIHCTSCGAPI